MTTIPWATHPARFTAKSQKPKLYQTRHNSRSGPGTHTNANRPNAHTVPWNWAANTQTQCATMQKHIEMKCSKLDLI